MGRLTPVIRISIGLVGITLSIVLLMDAFGLLPDSRDDALDRRVHLAELVAHQIAAWDPANLSPLRAALEATVSRNEDLLSAGLRASDGRLLLAAGEHVAHWQPEHEARSTPTHVRVPIARRGRTWARLELRFVPLDGAGGLAAWFRSPLMRIVAVLGAAGFVGYLAFMRRALRHLDPSAVIPTRLQKALNVMVEGVMIVTADGEIVLANAALARRAGRSEASLLGARAGDFDWRLKDADDRPRRFPWEEAIESNDTVTETELRLFGATGEQATLVVNAAPVRDGWDRAKGAIVTFDDVTELEQKSARLEEALVELEKSRDEIRLQNEELQILATRDPLTGITNRRAFFSRVGPELTRALREGDELCIAMVDLDHFKRVNDSFGHAVGDEVLRRTAELLREMSGDPERVCRYGGEEFCIQLDGYSLEKALGLAEQLRAKIAAPAFASVPVTASIGVAALAAGAADIGELTRHADEAMYRAKRGGRNRVEAYEPTPDGPSGTGSH